MTHRTLSIPEPDVRVLNTPLDEGGCVINSVDASKALQKLMLRMKGEAMSGDGSAVDYARIKTSALFSEYTRQAATLRHVDLSAFSDPEKVAFFINIYNALTIHGLVTCADLPKSVLNVQLFWKTTAYNIGEDIYSLDDIEHGVLRGNRPHPASRRAPFDVTDPRLKNTIKKLDPRIHFALVCGAKSCPAINVYTADNLDKALEAATSTFCQDEVKVYSMQKEIHVSRLFQWYKGDFGENDVEAIRWTLPYLAEGKRKDLTRLLRELEEKGMVDISYKEYDWSLNSMERPVSCQM